MHVPHPTTRLARPRGFTLTEVMFAVILLGVGFIMLAAMFPVAIQQSKSNVDESQAATIARGMANVAQQLGQYEGSGNLFIWTAPSAAERAKVYSLRDPQQIVYPSMSATNVFANDNLWKSLSGDLINSSDPRYASVLLYKREYHSSTAQLYIFVTQAWTHSQYAPDPDLLIKSPAAYSNLQARGVNVSITNSPLNMITFNNGDYNAVAEGCYVVIANDNISGASKGLMNGRVYRIGNHLNGMNWELIPGNDFQPDSGADGVLGTGDDVTSIINADAFVVGKDISTGSYEGPAQDVAFYTTFISVR